MAVRNFSTPGVYRREIDLSNIITPAGNSTGAIVVRSNKGPINRPVLITSDQEYIQTFGEPVFTSGASDVTPSSLAEKIPDNGYGSYAALEFLKESGFLYVARMYDSNDKYASVQIDMTSLDDTSDASTYTSAFGIAADDSLTVPDKSDEIQSIDNQSLAVGYELLVSSLFPGEDGNDIAITLETFSTSADWRYNYDDFTSATDASSYPIGKEIVKIEVYVNENENKTWSQIKTEISAQMANDTSLVLSDFITPVETWYVSTRDLLDANKNQLKASTVINGNSSYIYVKETGVTPTSGYVPDNAKNIIALSGGVVSSNKSGLSTSDESNAQTAWDLFSDRNKVRAQIFILPDYRMSVKKYVASIVSRRKDAILITQSGDVTVKTDSGIISDETFGYVNPSYVALYAGYDRIVDVFNNKKVFLPKCIFAAKACVRTDNELNVWDAPAGTRTGILSSLDQSVVFTDEQIGNLYNRNINTSKRIEGVGHVLWGQKTAQLKASALNRINVRRLLIFLQNSIEPLLQDFLFTPNNAATRLRVFTLLDKFLAGVQSEGGLQEYQVIVDESNNTPQVIENNQLIVDMRVNPTRTTEFIQFRTIVVNEGVEFV